jgi:hypothetical protein
MVVHFSGSIYLRVFGPDVFYYKLLSLSYLIVLCKERLRCEISGSHWGNGHKE